MGKRKFKRILKFLIRYLNIQNNASSILISFVIMLILIVLLTSEEDRFINDLFVYYIIVIFIILIIIVKWSMKFQAEENIKIVYRNLSTTKKVHDIIKETILDNNEEYNLKRLRDLRSSYYPQQFHK